MKNRIKKVLSTRFTFMVVPHSSRGPLKFNIPLSAILACLFVWTGITFWGSYLSAKHIDYWRSEVSNKVLNLKVEYLLTQMEKSRTVIDEVRQMEGKLRDLLQYETKSDIITSAGVGGAGGPSTGDVGDVARILKGEPLDTSWDRLVEKVGEFKKEAVSRLKSFENLTEYIQTQQALYRSTPRGWPASGYLSSHFGHRLDPFSKLREWHYGVDISGPTGTPVRATADGKVRIAGWHSGYGKLVVLNHDFGYSTRYAHNSRLLVKPGDEIKRGQVIALMGNTGKSSGPHCHYEVWRHKKRLNPYAYLIGNFPDLGDSTVSTTDGKQDKS